MVTPKKPSFLKNIWLSIKATFNAIGNFFKSSWDIISGKKKENEVELTLLRAPEIAPSDKQEEFINQKDDQTKTPLMKRIESNNLKMVQSLLSEPGIDLAIKDYYGNTALNYAIKFKNAAIFKSLLKHLDTLDNETIAKIYDASEVESEAQDFLRNDVAGFSIKDEWYKTHKKGEDVEIDVLLTKLHNIANPEEMRRLDANLAQTHSKRNPQAGQIRKKILIDLPEEETPDIKPVSFTYQTQGNLNPNKGTKLIPAIGRPKADKQKVKFSIKTLAQDPESGIETESIIKPGKK